MTTLNSRFCCLDIGGHYTETPIVMITPALPTDTSVPVTKGATSTPLSVQTLDPDSEEKQSDQLFIVSEGLKPDTYLIGGNTAGFIVGSKFVVYDEVVPNAEIPIALLHIVAMNPSTISTQAILVHPDRKIRPNFRVDENVEHLSTSELVPSFKEAVGYFLQAGRIRLRPDSEIDAGTVVQAVEPQLIGGAIVDYLPFDAPIEMRVKNMGIARVVASVELLTGEWPAPGTIIVQIPSR